VLANCHQQGVIVMSAGPQRNVVCLLPPLVIEKDLLREGLHALASSIIEEATRY
jgi:4-aminobutyrate aminotransferase/(S)-3-amino-2-methylpropionate transaminase